MLYNPEQVLYIFLHIVLLPVQLLCFYWLPILLLIILPIGIIVGNSHLQKYILNRYKNPLYLVALQLAHFLGSASIMIFLFVVLFRGDSDHLFGALMLLNLIGIILAFIWLATTLKARRLFEKTKKS